MNGVLLAGLVVLTAIICACLRSFHTSIPSFTPRLTWTIISCHEPSTDALPRCLRENYLQWEHLNAKTMFWYLDRRARDTWIREHCSPHETQAYFRISGSGTAQADFFRIVVLLRTEFPSLWVDADTKAFKLTNATPLDAALELFHEGSGDLTSSIIGSRGSSHPILQKMLTAIIDNINKDAEPHKYKLDSTGPLVLQRVFFDEYGFRSSERLYGLHHKGEAQEMRYSDLVPIAAIGALPCYRDAMQEMRIKHWSEE